MSKNQYSWADKFPTLTELFFGKDDPATYAPSYLSGKGKKINKSTEKAITKKPIKEVQTKAPKNAKMAPPEPPLFDSSVAPFIVRTVPASNMVTAPA